MWETTQAKTTSTFLCHNEAPAPSRRLISEPPLLADASANLQEGCVQVWAIPLTIDDCQMATARELLSPDELARADRYRFDVPRRTFVACRAALRVLLGHRIDAEPGSIRFAYGEYGKPHLADASAAQFNVSHSGDWGLIALTLGHRVGVDIELIRSVSNMGELVASHFSAAEAAEYAAIEEGGREQAFFNGWTRKEAFIKATGKGLAFPLRDFDVSLQNDEDARLLRIEGDFMPVQQWSLRALSSLTGYCVAVAVDMPDAEVRCFNF